MDPAEPAQTLTLEAFADTIIPGEKRFPDDRSVAGASTGGGAVAAGAVDLLRLPAVGLVDLLPTLVEGLNEHAREYAAQHDLELAEPSVAFVELPFTHRTALVAALTRPGHPEQELWVGLALFSNMAFDTAAHLSTADALAAGHPGLVAMGFAAPESDGRWRFSAFSYGRQLAQLHPQTTSTGSPA